MKKTNITNSSVLEETREIYDLFTFLYNTDEITLNKYVQYEEISNTCNKFTRYVLKNKKDILSRNIRLPTQYSCTCLHSINVMIYAVLLCKELNMQIKDINLIAKAAFLHDIGKKYVPENIIEKRGMLSDEEFETIKMHPILGYSFIQKLYPQAEREVKESILLHHGTLDKKGYPCNLIYNGIPIAVQIISIIDKFEAYTGERSYHKGRSLKEGFDFIKKEPGLNKKYVKALCNMLKSAKDINFEIEKDTFIFR